MKSTTEGTALAATARDSIFQTWDRPAHDGSIRCVLCAGSDPGADHEWCLVAENLVCDECCAALLHGDLMRMFSIASHAGRVVTPDSLIEMCAECPRAHRHAAEELLEEAVGDSPAC